MFTGLIEDVGAVRGIRRGGAGATLTVSTALPMSELVLGESIAVNGICLTLTSFGGGTFTADVSPETLERSTLGELAPGASVNLERAMRLGGRLGGHLVTGHVDEVGSVLERRQDGNAIRFRFGFPSGLEHYVVEKGSIAVDGISLTVNDLDRNSFGLAVIPHTLAMTTLKDARQGTRVNLECDIIGKYVERLLKPRETTGRESVDLQFLAKHGFL